MPEAVKLFKALADETRLRILHLLCHRELCVCHIVDALEIGQSKASRHLAHLRNAGLVNDRREGLWMYYSLAKSNGKLHRQIMAWIKKAEDEDPAWGEDLAALDNLAECGALSPNRAPGRKPKQSEEASFVNS